MYILNKVSGILLFIILLFSMPAVTNGQSNNQTLITELQLTTGDSTFRYVYYYGNNSQKTLETKYIKKNDGWLKNCQKEWIYNGKLCSNLYIRKWEDNNWSPENKIDYIYDGDSLSSEINYIYANNEYEPVLKHSKAYKKNRIILESDSFPTSSGWTISSKTGYKYKADTGSLDTIYFTKYSGGIADIKSRVDFSYNTLLLPESETYTELKDTCWVDVFKTMNYYAEDTGKKRYQTKKIWDNKLKKWVLADNITYEYTPQGNIQSETYQHWNSQFWISDLKYEYAYNNSGKLTDKTTYLPIYNDFRPVCHVNYSEFENGNATLIEAKNEFWGGEAGSASNTFIAFDFNNESNIQYGSKITLSFLPVEETSLKNTYNTSEGNLLNVYPNPSNGIFYFDTQKYSVKSWTICDISGKNILSKEINEKTGVIDLTDFQNGIYIIRVSTKEQGQLTQKLIKNRK